MRPIRADTPRFRFVAEDATHRLRVALGARVLIGAGSAAFWLLGRLGSREGLHAAERRWARLAANILDLRLEIEGTENIRRGRQYLVVSLHEGFADAIALFHLQLPLRFLVRGELFDWPALSRYLRATGHIEVEERPTRASLRRLHRETRAALDEGDSIVVFAQGSILGVEVAFRMGAVRLARSLGADILPVVISGSHRVWEHPYSPVVRLGEQISVRVLEPVASAELDVQLFRDLERRMKRIALDSSTAPARRFNPDVDGWWDDYAYEIDPDFSRLAGRLARRRANPPWEGEEGR